MAGIKLPPDAELYEEPSLKDKVSMFNSLSNKHTYKQSINPFSAGKRAAELQKRRFSQEDYGRPVKGSKTETRGFKANLQVYKEMLQLCEIIDQTAEPLFDPDEKPNDPRKVVSFGELFSIYVTISNKVVGILLRTRKQNLIDFEGEILYQRRDDDVPIILLQPIEEIRKVLNAKIQEIVDAIHVNEPPAEDLLDDEK